MIVRWDDMRADRALIKEYQKELDALLKNRIRGMNDIGLLSDEFEFQFAQYIGMKYAVMVDSGTYALELTLSALGIKEGDSVIIPDVTSLAVPMTIIHRGAEPIFVDIKEEDLNINEDLIEKQIKKNTKAIIAVHACGRIPCDMKKILTIANKYSLYVIEDTSQALGSTYKGKKLGSFGDISIFSFAAHKCICSCGGGGGAICFNNPKYQIIADYVKKWLNDIFILNITKRYPRISLFDLITIKTKLKYLKPIVESRLKIEKIYKRELEEVKNIKIFKNKPYVSSTPQDFPIFAEKRDELIKWLNKNGISVIGQNQPAFHMIENFRKYAQGKYPVSEIYHKKALHLPLISFMKEEEAMYVVDLIKKFYKR